MDDTTNLDGDAVAGVGDVSGDTLDDTNALTPTDDSTNDDDQQFDDGDNPVGDPDNAAAGEPDVVEVEYEGKVHKLPPELKDALLRQADYTRKTQEVAEMRKATEATLQQAQQVTQAERAIEAQYVGVSQAIQTYQQINWQEWMQSDPVAAQTARIEYDDLRTQQGTLVQQYGQAQAQRLAMTQQETARRMAEGQKVLEQKIPGWGEEKQRALATFATKEFGYTPQELEKKLDPRDVLVLHDAMQFRQLKADTQRRAKVAAAVEVKPVPTLRGNAATGRVRADTNDFAAFEKSADKILNSR